MKNKLFKILTALFVVCVMAFTLSACSNDGNKGNNDGDDKPDEIVYVTEGVVYEISDDQTYAIVKDYTGDAKYVEILSTYENLPVKVIGDSAFNFAFEMLKIKIPSSITEIGEEAFKDCYALIDVQIPSGVEVIKTETFSGCEMLSSVDIPNTVTEIESYAFSSCNSLVELKVSQNVSKIGYYAFQNCYALTLYCQVQTMPGAWAGNLKISWDKDLVIVWDCENNSVASDGFEYVIIDGIKFALKDESAIVAKQPRNIINANIPHSITYNGKTYSANAMVEEAFGDCYLLQTAFVPNSIKEISRRAFSYCQVLSSLTIESGVQTTSNCAIYDCPSLSELVIPQSVNTMDERVILDAPALTIYCEVGEKPTGWNELWVEEGNAIVWNCNENDVAKDGKIYKVIGGVRYALRDGVATVVRQPANLVDVVIPASVEYKGQTYAVTTIESYAFYQITTLKKVNILDGVETIKEYAFSGCYNFAELVISDSVVTVERCIITGDHYNLWVYCKSTTKPAGWNNSWSLISAVCYYSETEPTTSGNFWRYVDGVITRWGAE